MSVGTVAQSNMLWLNKVCSQTAARQPHAPEGDLWR